MPSFNADISGWDVSKVTTFEEMFWGSTAFNQDLSGWDLSSGEYLVLSPVLSQVRQVVGLTSTNHASSCSLWTQQLPQLEQKPQR